MRRKLSRTIAQACLVVLFTSTCVTAGTLKGTWSITISPQGRASLTTDFVFRKGGKGKAGNGLSGGAFAYREDESTFSATWEFAGPIIPAQSIPGPATIVLRGAKDSDDQISGQVTIITGEEDPESAIGYVTIQGTFVGVRRS